MMTSKKQPLRALLLSLLSVTIIPAAIPQAATDISGTWSGTLHPNHSNVAPFRISVVINPDTHGNLVGTSELSLDCMKDARLKVTVTGSTVVLAGSDKEGDNMTLRGSLDDTGTLLKSTYILNGSAGGGCETDDGTGTLSRR